ncbi:MAG: prepilin peptidase [archaeon]
MNFLFIFYFIGLIFAIYQDFTRREIDDWLNLFLFFSGIFFLSVFSNLFTNAGNLVSFGFFTFVVSLLSLAFYYGRFFSGGDSKLFFALSPILFNFILDVSFLNLIYFVIFLFVGGSAYSLIYSSILFASDFKKEKIFFIKELKKKYNLILLVLGVIFLLLGLLEKTFLLFGFLIFLFVFLFCMAKSLEEVSMKRSMNTKDLREGDWLFSDVKVGKKLFRKSWDGLSSEDIRYLKKFNKKVFIKDGIPYAPSFLFAIVLFEFRSYLIGILFS